jgi:hypothetical protein
VIRYYEKTLETEWLQYFFILLLLDVGNIGWRFGRADSPTGMLV